VRLEHSALCTRGEAILLRDFMPLGWSTMTGDKYGYLKYLRDITSIRYTLVRVISASPF